MPQPAIGDYALVGDTRTAALVSSAGSVDWLCVPRFDGPPLFSRLIDEDGGSFSMEFKDRTEARRSYLDNSPVVATEVSTSSGHARVLEGMVAEVRGRLLPQNLFVRWLECDAGEVDVKVVFDPRCGLPGRRPDRTRLKPGRTVCEWGALAVSISTDSDVVVEPGTSRHLRVQSGESLTLVMSVADRSPVTWVSPDRARMALFETLEWWQEWSDSIDYDGPFREAVVRSLITLRLLTYSPSGAPVAAPTTSLPEAVGGGRNWDYRYSWPRDAAIGLAAFLAVGKPELAHSFIHWLLHASRLSRPRLRVLYDVYGKLVTAEEAIDVSGYHGSRPVRVGNDARLQHQLDVYGWVIDAAWLLHKSGHPLHGETWRALSGFADLVADHWREPDAGIWEVRDDEAHYVHSKLMAWLALDRMTLMAERRSTIRARGRKWAEAREGLASWIRQHGIDPKRGNLVWRAGSQETDASLLLLPVTELEPADSPLVEATIDAIRRDLEISPGLLLRYPRGADGLDGEEGVFLPCSFWLVQALARTGKAAEATETFQTLLSYSNDLGLFGEEMDPKTKQQLGNFPQAFTHATLVQAALALKDADATEKQVS